MQREMARSGNCYGRWIWRIIPGASITTILEEEEAVVQNDHVARPIPVIETEEKLWKMRTYIGAVLQMSNGDGEIITDKMLYGALLNSMACNGNWCCIGERNKDGIFHVHALLLTSVRTDAWRRTATTMWKRICTDAAAIQRWGDGLTMDCIKCQKAHSPAALMQYMCKNPEWVLSSTDTFLQMAYDIWIWDLAARFREPKDKPNTDDANPMIKEILDCVMEHGCKTYEDVMKAEPTMIVKHLHKPGLQNVVQSCLIYAKAVGKQWDIANYASFPSNPAGIHCVILTQGISPDLFDSILYQWIAKKHPKRNTLYIIGPSNSGKTSTFRGLGQICPGGEIVNQNNFQFEGLQDVYWGRWDEPLLAPEQAEKFKQISGGEETFIPIKFKRPYCLKRTPILVTTNFPLWRWCENQEAMLRNRMFELEFKYDVSDGRFNPRTSESNCKCTYCKIARHGETDSCIPTTSRVHREEQSIQSTESVDAGNACSEPNASSGSMCRSETGSRGINESISSGGEQSSNIRTRGSTCTTTSNSGRSDTEHRSSDRTERICSTIARYAEQLESSECSRRMERMDEGMGGKGRGRNTRGHGRRSIVANVPSGTMVSMVDTRSKEITEMETKIPSKKRCLDGPMETMIVPTKEHWQQYLSYLYHKYVTDPKSGIDLKCYESPLSDSDSSSDEGYTILN
nr:nonstructural protein 1 NS1 [Chaphamaparvovirus anseriform 8]